MIDMAGKLTIQNFINEQAADDRARKRRIVNDALEIVLSQMDARNRRRPSRWDRFWDWVAIG